MKLASAIALNLLCYSPDEPRDSHGRWGDSGAMNDGTSGYWMNSRGGIKKVPDGQEHDDVNDLDSSPRWIRLVNNAIELTSLDNPNLVKAVRFAQQANDEGKIVLDVTHQAGRSRLPVISLEIPGTKIAEFLRSPQAYAERYNETHS